MDFIDTITAIATNSTTPGRTIRELTHARGIAYCDLAAQLILSGSWLDGLFVGDIAITPEMAKRLAEIFEPTAQFWLNYEANYRTTLARLEGEKMEA